MKGKVETALTVIVAEFIKMVKEKVEKVLFNDIFRDCGYRFSESSILSIRPNNIGGCQVCAVLTEEAKNLASVEPSNGGLAGATELTISDLKGTIPEFALWSKKQGFAESTIITRVKLLTILSRRGAELLNSESIKEVIANQTL